jgi:hypothetical protein
MNIKICDFFHGAASPAATQQRNLLPRKPLRSQQQRKLPRRLPPRKMNKFILSFKLYLKNK